jgi:hypothetical protein
VWSDTDGTHLYTLEQEGFVHALAVMRDGTLVSGLRGNVENDVALKVW